MKTLSHVWSDILVKHEDIFLLEKLLVSITVWGTLWCLVVRWYTLNLCLLLSPPDDPSPSLCPKKEMLLSPLPAYVAVLGANKALQDSFTGLDLKKDLRLSPTILPVSFRIWNAGVRAHISSTRPPEPHIWTYMFLTS